MSEADRSAPVRPVLVWDAATRITHWLLVVLVPFSWWSSEVAHRLDWHRWSGYTVIAVLVLRLFWGVFGTSTARFSQFVRGPRAIAEYVSGNAPPRLGHNPLGALSVMAMLGLLITQVCLGLFAVDIDGLESGPLSDRVSFETGRLLAGLHGLTFKLLLGLIALHLIVIGVYALRRHNLIGPMVTGRRLWQGEGATPAPMWRLALGLIVAMAVAYLISKGLRLRF